MHIPHYKGLILRKTFPQLTELIDKSLNYYPQAFPKARYNSTEHTWYFPSGAKIIFGSMQHSTDKTNYQGKAYDFIAFDELTHFTYEEYVYLKSRNRPNGAGTRTYIRSTANPGGIGHGWVKDRFITAAEPMNTIWDRVRVQFPDGHTESRWESRVFVPSSVFDNKILLDNDPNYLTRLASLPEAERKALLYGDWDSYSGQYFAEWKNNPEHYNDRQWTHVIAPFEIPSGWNIYRSFDWGYNKPFSCGWWAIDYDGVAYRILELYGCNGTPNEGVRWTADKVFNEIHKIETQHRWLKGKNIVGVADPAIFAEDGGESINESAMRHQVYFQPGDNKRIPGWMQMHYRLAFDGNGFPMMYVFNTCKDFIRTLPTLIFDDHKVEDLDTEGEDHCLTGDTQVLTDCGYKSIESLVGTEGKVLSHDGKYHNYHDVRLTQRQADIIAVELEDGTKIYCTDDHRFMLPNGEWKHADELMAGMELMTYGSRQKVAQRTREELLGKRNYPHRILRLVR